MRTIKKTIACLVAALMLLSTYSAAFTAAAAASGDCGDNVTWWFENSALIISGTGAMNDYGPGGTDTPWALSGRFYNSVEIQSGVTHIGDYAFYGSAVELVIIPDSVSSIGTGAFCGCSNLCLIHFDAANCADLTAESDAFSGCNANVRFLTVAIGESVQRIPAYLFYVSENYAGLGWELQNVQFNVGGNNGSNVASIGQSVFNNNATIADIYYVGTQQEWDSIPIGANNDALLAAPLHCYPPETSVCFGSYPQSEVTDAATLAALNALSLDWQSYGYYSGTGSSYDGQMTASNYMRYADVDYNGAKYRAVVFDSYRPTSTGSTSSADDSYQDDNSYDVNTVYWFRYEPLEWKVIDPATGLVMCTTIIDSQPYNNYVKSEGTDSHGLTAYWGDSAKTHYASDYANSSLRQWLNDDFYNTAFSAEEKSSIAPTILDNTGFNTQIGNSNYTDYDSASTTDNVFLLSFNEVRGSYVFPEDWQSESPGRMLTGSDYARSQGLWNSSEENYNWLLRSPGRGNALACVVLYDGRVRYGYSVNNTNAGIAPALRLRDLGSILATDSGACGDHLTWSIENGVLTISGAGEMYDFCNPYDTENSLRPPWADELYDEVVIGYGVTSIGSDAFAFHSDLTTVTISDTVTSIGNEAFSMCDNLSGVVIPDSVETVGERAFLNCTAMSTLTLGSGVTEIKIGAFASCSSLSSVVIPDSVETIGVSAFEGCSGVTALTIGSGVTSLGATAFAGCEALTEINYNVPNLADLTNEHGVFGVGTPVNTPVTVTFGDNVQHVPAYLFDRYEPDYGPQITTVYFGNALTSVGQKAFEKCTSITDVNYGGTQQQWNAITIGSYNEPLTNAELHCNIDYTCGDNLTWAIENGVLTISGTGDMFDYYSYPAPWDELSFSSVMIPYGVTSIGSYAFIACDDLTSVTIPDSVTTIGNYAFAASGLTSVTIPSTVTVIDDYAFQRCSNLESITVPGSVTEIGYRAFDGCTSLTDVYYTGTQQDWDEISIGSNNNPLLAANLVCSETPDIHSSCGDGVTWSIQNGVLTVSGEGAMYDFGEAPYFAPEWNGESFNSVVIGSGVTHIGDQAFQRLTSITSVTMADTVTSIGEQAFCGCYSLGNLTLGSGLLSIGKLAFSDCDALTSLTIPDSVTTLGDYAFQQCSSLATLTIGAGVTDLGDGTFQECAALTTVNYNAANVADPASNPYLFVGVPDANTSVVLNVGSSVQRIPAYLFWIDMPGYGSNITTVNIPVSVTAVGHDAFYNCTTITDVNYGGTQQQWNAITIGSNNDPLQNATKNFVVSGTCYENLTWAYDPYTRTLTISGTGEIKESPSPWASYGSSMKTLVVNSGVTGICDFAFSGCTGLTNVTLPDSVASIGDHAFNDTAYYKDQSNWQNGVLYINNHVIKATQFHANGAYVIRPGTKTIAYSAFYGCSGMTSVTIPNSVTSICDNAFMACVGLTELTIPDGVTSIRRGAFSLCRGLTSVTIPDGVTSIGELAFSRCTGLTSVTIPDSVTSIDRGVFYYCGALADVYFDGTQQQWNGITISTDMNDPLFAATIHCSDGTIGEAPEDTYSLSVGDQVAVNLVIDLAARNLEVSDVSITMDGQPVETSVTNDGDQYRFTIITAPAQIADEIVIAVGDETITTTVMDYCIALCGHEYDEYEKEQNLAKAILHYGKAANDWFDWTDEEITTFGELDHQPVQDYTGARFTDGTHQITSASFMALAKPEFRFYMSGVTEAQAAAYNSAGITAAYRDTNNTEELHARFKKAVKDGQTVVLVEVTGVSAENMNEEVVVNIPGLGQFTFNGNAFAKAMANHKGSEPDDIATRNLGAALYNYSVAAKACFKEEQP